LTGTRIITAIMVLRPRTNQFIFWRLLLVASLSLLASALSVEAAQAVPVNIFGDGDPGNGVEDSRQQLSGGRRSGLSFAEQRINTGTIKCDGKIRGTAMVLDTREFAPDLKGTVLVSAAHVLYDLEQKRRYRRCEFHFLALGQLRRYQAKIDLQQLRKGKYDPHQATQGLDFGEGDWVFLYVPRPWRGFDPDASLVPRVFSFANMASFQRAGGELSLVAFDASAGVMSVSRNCRVIQSSGGDLGGGLWKGQLLDDCDSGGGSSGGGIVAVARGEPYLIGIRNGSHWSSQAFPGRTFPNGPPDGARWDRRINTNFARAFDAGLISELRDFVLQLAKYEAL